MKSASANGTQKRNWILLNIFSLIKELLNLGLRFAPTKEFSSENALVEGEIDFLKSASPL